MQNQRIADSRNWRSFTGRSDTRIIPVADLASDVTRADQQAAGGMAGRIA
jgi:hypothetical protein